VCCSAVNDGSCSPWVMCSCSVVRGNQIRDSYMCSSNISYMLTAACFGCIGSSKSSLPLYTPPENKDLLNMALM